MRVTAVICFTVILSALGTTQVGVDPEAIVRRIVDDGISEGHDQKVIGRLGDASAVLITKILSDKDLTSTTIDNVLVVLAGSFADPRLVENPGDRQPRTALFVLGALGRCTQDVALRKRIAATTRYVQNKYTSSLGGP